MAFKIITDSASDVSREMIEKFEKQGIKLVNTIEELKDGVN